RRVSSSCSRRRTGSPGTGPLPSGGSRRWTGHDRPRMSSPEPIFLYGAGGHGRSVSEVTRRQGRYRIACMLDDDPALKGTTAAAPVVGGREALPGLAGEGIGRGFV